MLGEPANAAQTWTLRRRRVMGGTLEILLVLGIVAVVAMLWRIASGPSDSDKDRQRPPTETQPDDVVRRVEGWNI
jgi:hypothetical protein